MLVILFPVCDLRVWHESKILILGLKSRVMMQAWSKVLTSTLFEVVNPQYVLQTRPSSRTAVTLSRPLSQMIFGNPARRPYCGRINRVPVVKYSSLHTSCHISFPNSATSSSGHDLPSGSFVDHTRPDLFYHLSEPPTPLSPDAPVYALSFLPSASPVSNSATIIGWLPASTESQTEQDAGLNDFKENSTCLSFFLSRCTESAGLP